MFYKTDHPGREDRRNLSCQNSPAVISLEDGEREMIHAARAGAGAVEDGDGPSAVPDGSGPDSRAFLKQESKKRKQEEHMREEANQFSRVGIGAEEVRERVEKCFQTIFEDPEERFFHEVDADSACMVDTGNVDARTEGMSYGMMMCVQMDRQDLFDRLWQFSTRYMLQKQGKYAGYFAWSVNLEGKHNAEGPAPDGEEYFAMALFLASDRWGDRSGIFDYGAQAREILRHCVHQQELAPGGRAMWDERNHLIRFVPEADYSDPSYHLPHFYQVFAERANPEDRRFWREAAEASRKYLEISAHPVTGMSPEYAEYDGTPRFMFGKNFGYYSDAYRVVMNMALDTLWFGRREEYAEITAHLQEYFHGMLFL